MLGDPPVNYRLVDPAGKVLRRAYVLDELRAVAHLNGLKIWQQACQLDSVGDIIYDADRVLDHRTNPSTKRREYLIRWSGFSAEFDSWQTEQSIRDTPLLSEYWGMPRSADGGLPAASSVCGFLAPPRPPVESLVTVPGQWQSDHPCVTGSCPEVPAPPVPERNHCQRTVLAPPVESTSATSGSPPSPHALFTDAFACCCMTCLRRGGGGAVPLVEESSESAP